VKRGALGALGALGAAGCGGVQSPLNPAGPQAGAIAWITWLFLGVCGGVYLLTMGALVWALIRRRQSSDDSPETSRRLGTVITVAIGITIVTLVALTVTSVVAGRGLSSPPGPSAITVVVTGHQWWWDFEYQASSPHEVVRAPNELHIPVGVPVTIVARSADVIHSFWVPNLHGKRDLTPGFTTRTWIQADKPGVYRGQCAEFCGHQHAHMALLVVAEPMEQFERWLERQRRPAAPPASTLEAHGHDVFMTGPCVMCHTIRGTIAGSRFGPELTHLAGRQTLGAGTLRMTREHLARWVANSQSVKPGNRMPPVPLDDDDLEALVAYLETLR
jgi:cytochrome c oxidase subunit II